MAEAARQLRGIMKLASPHTKSIARIAGRIGIAALVVLVPRVSAAQIQSPNDMVPDLCASPNIQSARTGAWSDPATWSPARVPGSNDNVRVSSGTTVTFDAYMAAAAACVGIDGNLVFSSSTTRLWAGNILVYQTGYLQVGTASQPIPVGVTAEIVIANRALNTASDPDQYGTGLISYGKVRMHGASLTPTWTAVAQEPRAGQSTVVLSQAVTGWAQGDRLILPDTRHMKWNEVTGWAPTTPQWEELTLLSVSADGRTLTVSQPLRYDHLGARDGNNVLNFLPHVGNLSRNVVVRSEVPIGGSGTRGHVMLTYRADIDIRYTLFKDLGRTTTAALNNSTNHIGRYALHLHHLIGPVSTPANGYQYTLIGNALDGGSTTHNLKWALAIHDTHYGLASNNVLYNWAGSHVVTEDGSESYNVIESNFAVRSNGKGDRLAEGMEGAAFWFRGPNNYVRNNVAANLWGDTTEAAYGFKYFMRYLGNLKIPTSKGADTSVVGQYTTRDGNKMPILEFSGNEVYASAQGLTYWWVNTMDTQANPQATESVFRNVRIWHVYNKAIYHYPAAKVTFDNLIIRGKDPDQSACCGQGWHGEDYAATGVMIRNADIQGMNTGVKPSTTGTGLQTIENSYLRNKTNVQVVTMYNSNGGSWLPARKIILRNTQFAAWPGSSLKAVSMDWNPASGSTANTTQLDEVLVYSFNGNSSDNFRTYYSVQATQNVAGGLAPCTTVRTGIGGIACPIAPESGSPTPPRAPTNVRILP